MSRRLKSYCPCLVSSYATRGRATVPWNDDARQRGKCQTMCAFDPFETHSSAHFANILISPEMEKGAARPTFDCKIDRVLIRHQVSRTVMFADAPRSWAGAVQASHAKMQGRARTPSTPTCIPVPYGSSEARHASRGV